MASWNEKCEGEILEECPICMASVSKRRKTRHLMNCSEQYKEHMEDVGLIRCPLDIMHILPRSKLNHHLDGNCDKAQNLMRKYFQKEELRKMLAKTTVPAHFLADIPAEILSPSNKKLLYTLKRDLNGDDISSDKSLYPDEGPLEA